MQKAVLPIFCPPDKIALKGGDYMPLQVQPVDSRLRIRYELGLNQEGNPVYSTRTYSGIKPESDDQDVYDIAVVLTGLQEYPVASISRVNEAEFFDV
jgi:hypothetical protein